jgi:hypothetical protein
VTDVKPGQQLDVRGSVLVAQVQLVLNLKQARFWLRHVLKLLFLFNVVFLRVFSNYDEELRWDKNFLTKTLVPQSQCSLKENFRSKNYTLKETFWVIFLSNDCHCNSESKNYYITSQNCMYFTRENFQNLRQKRKWALWMRHRVSRQIVISCNECLSPCKLPHVNKKRGKSKKNI